MAPAEALRAATDGRAGLGSPPARETVEEQAGSCRSWDVEWQSWRRMQTGERNRSLGSLSVRTSLGMATTQKGPWVAGRRRSDPGIPAR